MLFQSESENDIRFEAFYEGLKELAIKHDISFADFQSICLKEYDYKILPCLKCGHLTVDRKDVTDENILPDFWFYVRRGKKKSEGLICVLCSE